MLILTNTGTDKLQITTSSAATVDVHASWTDLLGSAVTPGRTNTALSSAATTDVVATPAASTIRNVKTLHIRNKDAALACDITVVYNQNGTSFQIHKVTLAAGDTLEYIEGIGFFTINGTATTKLDAKLRVGADVVFATAATFADITGLTCPVQSGKQYNFVAHLYHFGNATTTGAQFGIGGVTMTAMRIQEIDPILASLTAAGMGTNTTDVTAVNTAAMAEGTGQATTPVLAILSGWFNPSATGTFAIRGTSEVTVAAGLTIKQGSWARVWEADN